MKNRKSKLFPHPGDAYLNAGLQALLISFLIYCAGFWAGLKEDQFFAVFLVNYGIAAFFFLTLLFKGRLRSGHPALSGFFISLMLFLVSAYALNRIIPVFELSVPWLNLVLLLAGTAYCLTVYFDRLAPAWRYTISFVLGIGFLLFLYLGIYLLPMAPVGLVGSLALGISLHVFVPLLLVIATIIWLVDKAPHYGRSPWFFLAGVLAALIGVLVFCLQWTALDKQVARRFQRSLLDKETDLPSWIKVAQEFPDGWLAERYLKAGLVYSTADHGSEPWGISLPDRNFDEVRRHDPLVMIATFFHPKRTLEEADRIRILQTELASRHKTERRLWSGQDLVTSRVISNIRMWPQYRMAYTEKTVTVTNEDRETGGNAQEAIYTFHLPEGGIVTALSLWIDGKESKGILTTKGKADSAYTQIVGMERRDPSVVHWKEGNRVSVRVFPVPAGGSRVFKLGITAPLAYRGRQLVYENIYFEGPEADNASEIVRVRWAGPAAELTDDGVRKGKSLYEEERKYRKDWSLAWEAPALEPASFSFEGCSYTIAGHAPALAPTDFRKVYLDINAAWTEEECMKVITSLEGKELYAYDDGLILLSSSNGPEVFRRLQKKHFSLFPLQVIDDADHALLVTKSGKASPDIGDLKGTAFGAELETWLNQGKQLCLFNLGYTLNPYLKTLKEHRAFRYEQGTAATLVDRCRRSVFAIDVEDGNHIVIHNAGLTLTRTADTGRSTAPDHFMRLFTYNRLMAQLRRGLYTNKEADTALVEEAQKAYVVSPLSSLVVLETAADYDRFGIRDDVNSLQNASLHSKGAVPEPHEWALLLLALVLTIHLLYRNKQLRLWNR